MSDYDNNTLNCERIIMDNHDDYVKLINTLQKDTKYVVIVQYQGWIDEKEKHILKARQSMKLVEKSKVFSFLGTTTRGDPSVKYVFERKDDDADFFKYLKSYNTFFDSDELPESKNDGSHEQYLRRNFGIDDFGFLDKDKKVLFHTVTHEHYTFMDRDYFKKVFSD